MTDTPDDLQSEYSNPFTEAQWLFVSYLPFRIGIWLSEYEAGGGDRAENAEMRALSDIIIKAQEKYSNRPVLEALTHELEQLVYGQDQKELNLDKVLNDCKRALTTLKKHLPAEDVNCYKLLCIDVAEAVAKAAGDREFGAHDLHGGAKKGWFGAYPMIASLTRLGHGPKVSSAEKEGINLLIDALGANEMVNKWEILE